MEAVEKKTKQKSREYPAVTISEVIAFIEKLKDYPQNKPISYETAAGVCGVKITTNSFKYLISAAKQYGMISTAVGKTITLMDAAKEFARPTKSTEELRLLKIECFKTPKLYAELIEEYKGQSLPQQQTLENILVKQYSIVSSVAKVAATTFIKNATEIGVVQSGILDLSAADVSVETPYDSRESAQNSLANEPAAPSISADTLADSAEFAAPLNIPFGDKRRAVLYMPMDATTEDAEYVKDMIALMFKRVYKVE